METTGTEVGEEKEAIQIQELEEEQGGDALQMQEIAEDEDLSE